MLCLFIYIVIYITICDINSLHSFIITNNNIILKNLHILSSFQTKKSSKEPSEVFYCDNCGIELIKWVGRCTSCHEWNTVKSFRKTKVDINKPLDIRTKLIKSNNIIDNQVNSQSKWISNNNLNNDMISMDNIDLNKATSRIQLFSNEINRVLGGGLVAGSVILLAGEPGIGKSTLLVQLASHLVNESNDSIVYISGEETPEQIASRTNRLQLSNKGIYILTDVDVDIIIDKLLTMNELPIFIIIDSIQTMYTSSCTNSIGSVTQIRETTARLIQFAKSTGVAIVLVGHVTKSGDIAGPRVLEHMVDTVLNLEGNEQSDYRLLRTTKNRFGSTSEIGVFSMTSQGLIDISNPSDIFLSSSILSTSQEGSAVAVIMEGSRPILLEIQSLVSINYGIASGNSKQTIRRTIEGYSIQRLLLICAVLEKRLHINLYVYDIYINIVGGIRISEPLADLAIAVTIVSSLLSMPIIPGIALIGEIGLRSELRSGRYIDQRITEAINMGFQTIIIPTRTNKNDKLNNSINYSNVKVKECNTLKEALNISFNISDVNQLISNNKKRKRNNKSNNNINDKNDELNNEYDDFDDN